jgi:hypothetical protein
VGGANITNVYNQTVVVNNSSRVSFNGGQGGLSAAPTPQDRAAEQDHHVAPTAEQNQQHQIASQNKQLLASANGGKPSVAATGRAGDFAHAVPAKAAGGPVSQEALKARPKSAAAPAGHPQQAAAPQHPQPAGHPQQAAAPQHPQPAAHPPQAAAPHPQPAAHRPPQAAAQQHPQPQVKAPQPQRASAPPPARPAPRPAPAAQKQAAPHGKPEHI